MRHLKFLSILAFALLTIGTAQSQDAKKIYPPKKNMYKKGWIDFNKNGKKDIYEDPSRSIDERLDDLLSQMTLEEKTNQLATYYGLGKVLKDSLPTAEWKNMILKDGIANIDEHLNGFPRLKMNETPNKIAESLAENQRFFVEYTRLGIPVDFSGEGIRGLNARGATSFPSMNGMGTTWNKDLAYKQGMVQARESRAMGYTNMYAPILDVNRDQRWGRWEGSIAEDPFLVAELGVAMAKGIQDQKVVSSPKHFVGYGDTKAARQWDARTDPHVTPSEMYYIHEYPFRRVFKEAGSLGVMCAYNDYDGKVMAGSYEYLTIKLRKEMGFKGYVVSDSYAVERLSEVHHVAADLKEACYQTVTAGLNVRTHFTTPDEYIGNMRELVKEGRIPMSRIDELVRQVLYVKFWQGLFDNPYVGDSKNASAIVSSEEFLDIALQSSRECLVLLKNDAETLPFKGKYKKIAVVGPNAVSKDYIPTHYGPVDYARYTSILDGVKNVYKNNPDVEIKYAKGIDAVNKGWPESELIPDTLTAKENEMIAEAVKIANESEVIVLALGDGVNTSGESRTRSSLDLPGHQQQLLEAMVKTGKPVVLVLVWGRPATINYADKYCKAILSAPYPGAQGGRAIGEALEGIINPGGKLNGTWPKTVGQLPMNIPSKPNANWEQMEYYTVANKGLLYCFGFGLSYTKFKYDNLKIDNVHTKDGNVKITCDITNTGKVEGDEVVQLYIKDVVSSTTTYEKNLRGFERVNLKPGETKTVEFPIVPDDLILINAKGEKVVEPGEFKVMVGASYEDIRLTDSFFVSDESGKHKRSEKDKQNDAKMMHNTDSL